VQTESYLTMAEAGELLKLSPSTIARYVRDEKLESIRFGHNRRILQSSIDRLIRGSAK
jgi:excisionase family DNA binding protein